MNVRTALLGMLAMGAGAILVLFVAFLPDMTVIYGWVATSVMLAASIMAMVAFIASEFVDRFLESGVRGLLEEAGFALITVTPFAVALYLARPEGDWPGFVAYVVPTLALCSAAMSYGDRAMPADLPARRSRRECEAEEEVWLIETDSSTLEMIYRSTIRATHSTRREWEARFWSLFPQRPEDLERVARGVNGIHVSVDVPGAAPTRLKSRWPVGRDGDTDGAARKRRLLVALDRLPRPPVGYFWVPALDAQFLPGQVMFRLWSERLGHTLPID